MEWLAANAVNLFMSAVMICGGVVFAMTLDTRLKNIEKEQEAIKQIIVVSARLEERISYLYQTVLSQGKRLDRVSERVLNGRLHQPNEECEH
jgi:hypothetical protein